MSGFPRSLGRDRVKVYTVLVEDRHIDPEVTVFANEANALRYARQEAENNASHPEYIEEKQIAGWLLYINYSVESDYVRVEEKELIK